MLWYDGRQKNGFVFQAEDGIRELVRSRGLGVVYKRQAAHIVPWNADVPRRGDPRNGICLNALHDRAFDRGLITLDSDHRVVLSSVLRRSHGNEALLIAYGGAPARLPTRFGVEEAALRYHREHVFLG